MTLRDYPSSALARQPIGYWSGHTYRTVVGRIRSDLAIEGLTQPTWWILNHLDGAPATWTVDTLTERLEVFDDQGTDFGAAIDDLRLLGLLTAAPDGTLTLTEQGADVLGRARQRSAATVAITLDGITDDDYVAALNVLRRIIDNLGANSDIP
jgi:hypothetical protein